MVHTLEDCIKNFGEIPLCQCGCGNKVNIILEKYYLYKKQGYPKFIHGHHCRICNPMNRPDVKFKHLETCNSVYFKQKVSERMKSDKNPMKNLEVVKKQSRLISGEKHYLFGKHHSKETITKMCESQKGCKNHAYGKELTQEHKEKISKTRIELGIAKGEYNPSWNGGTSFFPYCPKFNELKKEEIRNKYGRKCIICGKDEKNNIVRNNGKYTKLHVHHIDYNKEQGCKDHQWKLVPLCSNCHAKTNNKRQFWESKICEILTNIDKNAN